MLVPFLPKILSQSASIPDNTNHKHINMKYKMVKIVRKIYTYCNIMKKVCTKKMHQEKTCRKLPKYKLKISAPTLRNLCKKHPQNLIYYKNCRPQTVGWEGGFTLY